MKVDVSEPALCGCYTLSTQETEPSNVINSSVQPLGSTLSTQETEPANVIDSAVTSVQPLVSTSDQSSATEPPLAPPPPVTTTTVNPEPAPSVDAQTSSLPGPGFAAFSSIASSRQANVTNIFGSGASNASVPSMFGPMQAPAFGSGSSTASASSTTSPVDAPSPWSMQAPVQANGPNTSTSPFSFLPAQDSGKTASAFRPPFGYDPVGGYARPDVGISPTAPSGSFSEYHFSSPSGSLLPGFGVSYPTNRFGTIPQTSPFLGGGGTEQGSRHPPYAPTPDLYYSGGPGKLISSISASNSHGHKSHEELRWEDYQKGDKGNYYSYGAGRLSGWYPPAHTVSPSSFASPGMRTVTWPAQGNMTGFPFGYNNPTAVQRPHEPAGVGVSPLASECTACGATSSSSPSGHVGLNGTTNAPSSAATTLPYGSMPLMFGAPNLAAYGGTATTAPAVQVYVVIIVPRTTVTPAVQAYPMMFGTPNLVGQQGTTPPAVQPYPMMFGTPNLAAQSTSTAPAAQPCPTMFGTPSFASQGTTTAPAAQPYPMMFGTQQLAGQGTTTTPSAQPYPMMFGTPNTTTAPAVQPYAMMFGMPNSGAQAYPVNGLTLPFAAMSLQ